MTAITTPTSELPEQLLTAKQVAPWLQISENQVYRLAVLGQLPSRMIGGSRRFSRRALERYLDV
jgi:excisionase family DNA binding protein